MIVTEFKMLKLFHAADANLSALADAPVAILGFGNQGHAHALNLRDSGVSVIVGQRPGSPRFQQAKDAGFAPMPVRDAVRAARLLILALPDDRMAAIYEQEIAPVLRPNQAMGFIHGFNIHFRLIVPPPGVDVVMVAPKGPGRLLRSAFQAGHGIAALMAIQHDATGRARPTALAWANGIGCTRVGVLETSFAHETVADLFGEQTVLCGGMIDLMKAAFDVLVDAGYPEELAYFECVHEVKQIVDLIYDQGLSFMRDRISSTARYGGLVRGPELVTDETRCAMRAALADIVSGDFATRFVADARSGSPELRAMTDQERRHRLNAARERLFSRLKAAE